MLHLDPVRMRFGLRSGAPKLTPTNERTNVLTERIPTSSYRAAVLNARARTGRRVGWGLVSGCFHKRQKVKTGTDALGVIDSITTDCEPGERPDDERTAR